MQYPAGESEEIKAYKKYENEVQKRIEKDGLQSFIETVKNNKNLFDREYYIQVLKEMGIKIE